MKQRIILLLIIMTCVIDFTAVNASEEGQKGEGIVAPAAEVPVKIQNDAKALLTIGNTEIQPNSILKKNPTIKVPKEFNVKIDTGEFIFKYKLPDQNNITIRFFYDNNGRFKAEWKSNAEKKYKSLDRVARVFKK